MQLNVVSYRQRNERGDRILEMKKLLIADASEEFRLALLECLQEFYCIRVCREGNEALHLMETFKPDVVVLDLMLPGLDGVTLLRQAAARGLHTKVLATTCYYSEYIIEALEQLRVSYVVSRPCDVCAVSELLIELTQLRIHEVMPPNVRVLMENALLELHIPTYLHSCDCLREAILEAIRNPNQQLTKTLYPAVSKIYGGNGKRVERAIRYVIRKAWDDRDESIWCEYFPAKSDGTLKRPTSGVFICTLAKRILTESANGERYLRKNGS